MKGLGFEAKTWAREGQGKRNFVGHCIRCSNCNSPLSPFSFVASHWSMNMPTKTCVWRRARVCVCTHSCVYLCPLVHFSYRNRDPIVSQNCSCWANSRKFCMHLGAREYTKCYGVCLQNIFAESSCLSWPFCFACTTNSSSGWPIRNGTPNCLKSVLLASQIPCKVFSTWLRTNSWHPYWASGGWALQ